MQRRREGGKGGRVVVEPSSEERREGVSDRRVRPFRGSSAVDQ